MISKVSVYIDDTDDQGFNPGTKYNKLWNTVRQDRNVEQLISLFLDKANQIAARLGDNSATELEERAAAQFLVQLGAVVIEVLPSPRIGEQDTETVVEETSLTREVAETDIQENSRGEEKQADTDVEERRASLALGTKRRKGDAQKKDNDSKTVSAGEGIVADTSEPKIKNEKISSDRVKSKFHEHMMEDNDDSADDISTDLQPDVDYKLPESDSESEGNDYVAPRRCSTRLNQRSKRKSEDDINKKQRKSKTKIKVKKKVHKKKSPAQKSESELFPCRQPLCYSKLCSRQSLIKHLTAKHKFEAEKAHSTVFEWYKRYARRKKRRKALNTNLTPFVCMICKDIGFQRRVLLHSHMCTVHDLTEEQSKVEVAKEYGVLSSTHLPDSVFYSVDVKIKAAESGHIDKGDAGNVKQTSKPVCPKCEAEFDQVSEARSHFESECTSNPLQCNLCGTKLATIGGYKVHMETHSNQQHGLSYKCETCNKVFYHKYTLSKHEMTHNPGFICDFCGKSFPIKALCENHRNNQHTKEKKFPCSECPKVYYTKKALRVHAGSAHSDLEMITCHICGKMMKPASINIHITTVHGNEGTVQCQICNKEFKRQNILDDHTKEVHGGGAGVQYSCTWPNCDKVFIRKRSLKCHLDVHNDVRRFECSVCPKKFRSKAHLANHTNWHNGIKPYQCPHCEKSFLTNGNLTKHLVTHTRKKPSHEEVNAKSKEILMVSSQATPIESQHQLSSLMPIVQTVVRTAAGTHVPIGEMHVELDAVPVVSEAYN